MTQTLVIGLDCAAPHLVFERFADVMPNVTRLRRAGIYGKLRSVAPPITVPAWACMTTGLDPGELGVYGFRLRERNSYGLRVATSRDIPAKRVWDHIGESGQKVAALFVPPNAPPRPVNGTSIGCFLTPDSAPFVFPRSLETNFAERFGAYRADVDGFRVDEPERIRRVLLEVVDHHFAIAKWTLRERTPAFAMMVEIAIDRLHHAFYKHLDPLHSEHDPSSPWCEVGAEVYGRVDAHIGELLSIVGDACNVLVVSDHGARPMLGGFCVNDWLIERGYLVLHETPSAGTPLTADLVDWSRTRAFGEGGYYGRIFANVRGREPSGIVDDLGELLTTLERELASLEHPQRGAVSCRVDRPANVYRAVRGFAPDLMIYPGDLDYRVLGTMGHASRFVATNDRGPDSCNHDWNGIFIGAGPGFTGRGEIRGASLLDIAPTLLALHGLRTDVPGRDLRTLASE